LGIVPDYDEPFIAVSQKYNHGKGRLPDHLIGGGTFAVANTSAAK
jgi:hypothetical protein